jgi:hypothetical protein
MSKDALLSRSTYPGTTDEDLKKYWNRIRHEAALISPGISPEEKTGNPDRVR